MAKNPKYARPRSKELRLLYKRLVTTSIVERIVTLTTILQWYDQAMDYVISKGSFDQKQLKWVDKATSARKLGISSTNDHEKEQCFRTAVRLYEKVCKVLHPYPLDKAYEKYEQVKVKLEKKQVHLEGRFGAFLEILKVLNPIGIDGKPLQMSIVDMADAKKFDPVLGQLHYNRQTAKLLQATLRQKGVLPLVAHEMKTLSRAAALEPDGKGEGGYVLNAAKQADALLAMMSNFVTYCYQPTAPKRLIRVGAEGQVRIAPSAEKVNIPASGLKTPVRSPYAGRIGARKAPKVANLYVVGSACAVLHEALTDEKWHETADLQKLTTSNLKNRLGFLKRVGPQQGYKVEFKGTQVRMTKEA